MPVFCFDCEKIFSTQSNLNRHRRNVHKLVDPVIIEYPEEIGPYKCLEGCRVSFKRSMDLRNHLNTRHSLIFNQQKLEFISFEEFEVWLESEERNKNVNFVKSRGTIRCQLGSGQNLEKFYFDCVRTGSQNIKNEKSRKRSLKSQGSAKINMSCSSQIIVTKYIETGRCDILYYPDHYGHHHEIRHLRLSKGCRKNIASKLMAGVSTTHILDTSKDEMKKKVCRDDILTRQDIVNIKKSYNIALQDGIRHRNDATSVDLLVKQYSTSSINPVLFYKKQGEIIMNINLEKNDFCLILMYPTQKELFKKFGSNVICIDSTHGLNSYNFELTTLLVIDEFGEGFPVAFLFSNKSDTYIYEIFFNFIKTAVGEMVVPRTFMSDVTNVYYNAWEKVVGPSEFRLYCSWHIDRAWQQNLAKVKDLEKRKWVYQTLKYLQTTLEETTFEAEYTRFLNILDSDESTKEICIYLKHYYYDNRQHWAYCYRKMCGINTNMFLESMHKVIKYIYLEGKKIKRLDKALHALEKFVRDKSVDRIIKIIKNKPNRHLHHINQRHRAALTEHWTIRNENDIYIISKDNQDKQYIIIRKKTNMCCELNCKYCKICIHMYQCSCIDYNIRTTICKHIHFLCLNYLSEQDQVSTDFKKTEDREKEVCQIVENLNRPSLETHCDTPDLSSEIKTAAIQVVSNIDNFNYTYDEKIFMLKNLKVLLAMGSNKEDTKTCFVPLVADKSQERNFPGNKLIDKQNFFSTKKKGSHKGKNKKPVFSELNIIKETLSQSLFTSTDPNHDHSY